MLRGAFRTQSKIYDIAFCKNRYQLLVDDFFGKKAPSMMIDRILNLSLIIMQ